MSNPAWTKGMASPNPAGRRTGSRNRHPALNRVLKRIVDPEALGQKLYEMALGGDLGAIRYIYDRIDGSPRQTIEMNEVHVPKVQWFNEDEGYPDGWEEPKEGTG